MKTRFKNMIISLGGGGFQKIGLLKLHPFAITYWVGIQELNTTNSIQILTEARNDQKVINLYRLFLAD